MQTVQRDLHLDMLNRLLTRRHWQLELVAKLHEEMVQRDPISRLELLMEILETPLPLRDDLGKQQVEANFTPICFLEAK